MVQLKVNFRSMVNRMDISEVVKISGLPPSTLRYYEQIKLIRSVGRNGLRRQYSSEVLNKLNIIRLGRLAGLSLNEISEMFNSSEENTLVIDRDLLAQKAQDIDDHIKRLQAVRDSLNHVASCPYDSHLECKSFQKLMKLVRRYTPAQFGIKS